MERIEMNVFAEVSENHKRIEVWFPYNPSHVAAVKALSGARFVPKDKGGPFWSLPLDINVARQMRHIFGDQLELGNALKVWGHRLVAQERQLQELASADSAELQRLPELLPDLYQKIHIGPQAKSMNSKEIRKALSKPSSYQAADVMFGVVQRNPLNANEPGTGKTIETIGAIFEAKTDDGPTLVVAPKTALNSTWRRELEANQPHPVYVSTGSKQQKLAVLEEFENDVIWPGFAGWLIVNPDQVRYREDVNLCRFHLSEFGSGRLSKAKKRDVKQCPECTYELLSEFPILHETAWNNVIIDEAHKGALRYADTLTAMGMLGIPVAPGGKKFALTGTPMGGRIMNMYGILHWLNPDVFSSKWRFAGLWCDILPNRFSAYGDISNSLKHCQRHTGHDDYALGRPDCDGCRQIETDFYAMLMPYVIRRTKAQVAKWLPPKDFIDIWCEMDTSQRKQYLEFVANAAMVIDDVDVTANSVLAEFVRLKQIAFSRCELRNGKVIPTTDSCKLEAVRGKLEELGIIEEVRPGVFAANPSATEQVVIFSQFAEVVSLVHMWLLQYGVKAAKITGGTRQKHRDSIQEEFQIGGDIRVLVMTTTAGGVSITLDRANTVFILDETWDPDDQTQASDRVHRVSRIHQVTVYAFRTQSTVEEYILAVIGSKNATNATLNELRAVRLF